MKTTLTLLLAGVLLGACAPAEDVLAIENVAVVAMDANRVLAAHTVLIEAETITAVGPTATLDVPRGALRVDGSGLYVMPGIAEMHAHLPADDDPPGVVDAVLTLFVSQGVTFARGMLGADAHPALRDAIAAGERLGPTLLVASPMLTGEIDDPEQARARVQRHHREGFDLLKIGEGLSPEVYEALVAEARRLDMPFAGHVADAVGLLDSLAAGQATVDHLDNYVEALRSDGAPDTFSPIFDAARLSAYAETKRIPELVAATRDARTAVVPTMLLWQRFFGDEPIDELYAATPEARYLPRAMVADWERRLSSIRERVDAERGQDLLALRKAILEDLHAGGVYILLGSDAPQVFSVPGFSAHAEMRYLQDVVGLPPFEILFSATRAVPEHLGQPDAFGTILPGRRADLMLLRGNPLEDVANVARIEGVVLRGRWLSRQELDTRLEAIAARFDS